MSTSKSKNATEMTVMDILASTIEWRDLPMGYDLTHDDLAMLEKFSDPNRSLTEKFKKITIETMMTLIRVMDRYKASDPGSTYAKVGYIPVVLHEMVRENFSRYETILGLGRNKYRKTLHVVLQKLLKDLPYAIYADKTAILASGLVVHDEHFRDINVVMSFVESLIEKTTKCTSCGVLHCLANFLKLKQFRSCLWNITGVHILIRANLNPEKVDTMSQYLAVFCVWLYTLGTKYIFHLNESGLLNRVLELLQKEPRVEKIVRLSLEVIDNSITADQDEAMETMIALNIGETLDILEFQKWKSEELYNRIRQVKKTYLTRVKSFSTFQRYITELSRGELSWGYLHSEEFWTENVMEFEDNEFAPVKMLIQLLQGNDSNTVAVACNDIGEFARLHPAGKKILSKFDAKSHLLKLIRHDAREIQKQSLLAVQKMMLQNWQKVEV